MADTWIVVADSAQARIFSGSPGSGQWRQIEELVHAKSRIHEREVAAGEPGRIFNTDGQGRRGLSQSVSPREHEAVKFCRELAEELESARVERRYGQLVLVAAPAFLGLLRKTISVATARLISQELDKDLAHMDQQDVLKHIHRELGKEGSSAPLLRA